MDGTEQECITLNASQGKTRKRALFYKFGGKNKKWTQANMYTKLNLKLPFSDGMLKLTHAVNSIYLHTCMYLRVMRCR